MINAFSDFLTPTRSRCALFQQIQEQRYEQEQLEEQFEETLANCSQVTPGKPLEEVDIFLIGNPTYDALPPQLALAVYSRYQVFDTYRLVHCLIGLPVNLFI